MIGGDHTGARLRQVLQALQPKAVFSTPLVLLTSAPQPVAVLLLPPVLFLSALQPVAVLPLCQGSEFSFHGHKARSVSVAGPACHAKAAGVFL